MSFSPIPKFSFPEITDISPDFLQELGIKFLMVDLDNTIAAYSEHQTSSHVFEWADEVKSHGIELFIVSNSLSKARVGAFKDELDVDGIMNAHKPSPTGVINAMSCAGYAPSASALIGDQIFTDTLAANRAGVVSIIVKPRQLTNPLLALRYVAEKPFRAMCKKTNRNDSLNRRAGVRPAKSKQKVGTPYEQY